MFQALVFFFTFLKFYNLKENYFFLMIQNTRDQIISHIIKDNLKKTFIGKEFFSLLDGPSFSTFLCKIISSFIADVDGRQSGASRYRYHDKSLVAQSLCRCVFRRGSAPTPFFLAWQRISPSIFFIVRGDGWLASPRRV